MGLPMSPRAAAFTSRETSGCMVQLANGCHTRGQTMDPNVAWSEMERAEADRDRARIAELADGLIGWLEKDGFLPRPLHSIGRKGGLVMLRWIRSVAEMA